MVYVGYYLLFLGAVAAGCAAFAYTLSRLTDRKAPPTEPPLSQQDKALLAKAKSVQAEREEQMRWVRNRNLDVADSRPELRAEARNILWKSHGRLH